MKFIGSCQGRNKKYLEILYERKFGSYREMLLKMGYKDEDFIKRSFDKQTKTKVRKIPGNVMAQSMASDKRG